LIIFIFVGYYLVTLYTKEKKLEKKEGQIDTNYHQIVNDALTKERKILEDATFEADQIITGAQYSSSTSKEAITHALAEMLVEIKKEANTIASDFTSNYSGSLKQLTAQSLNEFQHVARTLEEDLQKQISQFHTTLLPNLEKEIEAYKQARIKQADEMVVRIIQQASQDILNKSISLTDHQDLVMKSLEKAKKEGMFG